MLMRLLAPLVIAGLLLPVASASDTPDPDDTLALGRAVASDAIQITFILPGSEAEPGDLLPLCSDSESVPLEEGEQVIGSIEDSGSCFQSSSVFVTGECSPLRLTIFGTEGPVAVGLDERCLEDRINELLGGGPFKSPLRTDMILRAVYA